MLAPAITLLLIMNPAAGDSAATRKLPTPCQVVEEKAVRYFEERDFDTNTKTEGEDIVVDLGNHEHASTPAGKPLSLNRFSVRKYALPRHLSPLKAYDLQLKGHLRLVKTNDGRCDAALLFEISAYEWVWSLGMIDDGYKSTFISNGTLERLYIEPIGDLFLRGKH